MMAETSDNATLASTGVQYGEWVAALDGDEGLPQRIADQVAQAIIEGQLPSDHRLSEVDLAKAFGTSRTPVREALQRLEGDGLVDRQPRKGARVRPLSAKQAKDVYVCRAQLYGFAARLATAHLTVDDLDQLDQLVDRMIQAAEANDPTEYFRLNIKFHSILAQAGDNEVLLSLMERMGRAALRFRFISVTIPGRMKASAQGHVELAALLRKGDSSAAERVVQKTIAEAGDAVMSHLFGDDTQSVSKAMLAPAHGPPFDQ